MIVKKLYDELIELINNELMTSAWSMDDKFFDFRKLSIDQRGRVGEHFFKLVFKELNILNNYVNNAHGDWDIEADNFKIEVKTASLDINNKFQHEGVKENKLWDVVAFLDIAPNDLYVTFIHKDSFTFGIEDEKDSSTIYGKVKLYGKEQRIHFRGKDNIPSKRSTGAGYKVDFKLSQLKSIKTIKDIENIFNEMKKNITSSN